MIELSHKPLIRAYQMDCMEFMAGKREDWWDLAIVDPPYNVGASDGKFGGKAGNAAKVSGKLNAKHYTNHNKTPNSIYFKLLFDCSKNQIIWGANYYPQFLYHSGAIVWDKVIKYGPLSDCEIAFHSFNKVVRKFSYPWVGANKGWKKEASNYRVHPNQKPVSLYTWLLTNYAKPGQRIFDSHGGSFSSAIACWHEGYDMDICELDNVYFEAACERFERETRQHKLFPVSGGG